MEHSALHALILIGLVLALGGPIAVLGVLWPAGRTVGAAPKRDPMLCGMVQSAARWVTYGTLAAALGALADLFVGVAEIQGTTVFSSADLALVFRFATQTTVGRLSLARAGLLLLTAGAARFGRGRKWWLVAALAAGALVASALVSHAAAQPEHRFTAIIVQIAHISAAAIWMGVLLHLLVARGQMLAEVSRHQTALIAEIVRKFSPIALAATLLLVVTGLLTVLRYGKDTGALVTSAYGLTLLVKLVLLTPAIFAGFVNFRFIRPALLAIVAGGIKNSAAGRGSAAMGRLDPAEVLHRFSRMLELEVTAGVLVITVAGILGSISLPREDGSQRLTATQVRALLSPHLPTTEISHWADDDDSPELTIDDLHYSEFTHNWSGVAVCLLGTAWMAQGVGGTVGLWAGRLSLLPLLGLGLFVGLAANPELWLLRRMSPGQALADPISLEHQLAAFTVLGLAWLGWRTQKAPHGRRLLSYGLPAIMIAGSLLLLGHAHSMAAVPDELTNLINVQHAVMGGLGLFAGTGRLLVLRGLVRTPRAAFVWPGCIIAIGLFMTFFYREVVV